MQLHERGGALHGKKLRYSGPLLCDPLRQCQLEVVTWEGGLSWEGQISWNFTSKPRLSGQRGHLRGGLLYLAPSYRNTCSLLSESFHKKGCHCRYTAQSDTYILTSKTHQVHQNWESQEETRESYLTWQQRLLPGLLSTLARADRERKEGRGRGDRQS